MKNEKTGTSGRGVRHFVAAFLLLLTTLFSGNAHALADALRIRIAAGSYSDEIIIRFLPDATEGFDASYDSWKLFSSNASVPNIFSKISTGSPLAINALPDFTASVTMPVFLRIGTAATYTVSAEEPGAFASGVKIMMKDLVTGQLYDLRTTGSYTISLPVIAQTDSARFQVFFSYPAASLVTNATCSSCADGAVSVTKAGETNWQYTITDSTGNTLSSGIASGPTESIQGLAAGNYTVGIEGNFSCSENKPVVVKVTPLLLGATFVELTAVYGTGAVDLSWSTGMESNTSYFTVERSSDGTEYRSITHVGAAGNSSSLLTYHASDNAPSRTNSYYRIKLTDLNGQISYSEIVFVTGTSEDLVSVFPNPASDILNVVVDGHKGSEVFIVVRDLTGKTVLSLKTVPGSDRARISIDIPSMLVRGVYTLSAIGAEQTTEQKIILK